MRVGDRCSAKMFYRATGYDGGWASKWVPATIAKVNKKTVWVRLDFYYGGWAQKLPLDRIRVWPEENQNRRLT